MHGGHHCDCGPFRITLLPQGILKPLILRLLSERPMHGYVIMEQIFERTQGMWRPTPASIYPTLAWLEEMGYITETEEASREAGERARRPYGLTAKGRSALKNYSRFREEWAESLSRMKDLWW
jgi:DNA-binding PadR family transcriptional regulator